MATLFGILQVGARGVYAAQAGLDTTGHNIANANTEGYSRQRLVQVSANPLVLPNGAFGQGVDVVSVERVRDEYLEKQIRDAQSDSSFYSQQDTIFNEISAILNDPLDPISETLEESSSGGLNNLIAKFFSAWNELSLNPQASEVRSTTLEIAQTLAETFARVDEDLTELRQDLDNRIQARIEEVNTIADDLVRINQEIAVAEVGGQVSANDLRDRRDNLLHQLSEIIPINTLIDDSGQVAVTVLGSRLVDGQSANHLVAKPGTADGQETVNIFFEKQGIAALDPDLKSGELGGLVDARDRIITYLLDDVDELARSIINEVNRIHCASVGLEGYTEISTQIDLPDGADDVDSLITLNQIFNDPRLPSNATNADVPYEIQDGSFTIRVADEDGDTQGSFDVAVRTDDTMETLRQRIDRADGIVGEVLSGASFDPVYVEDVVGVTLFNRDEILPFAVTGVPPLALSALLPEQPVGTGAGPFSLEVHVKDADGAEVDTNPATPAVDPFVVTINPGDTMVDFVTNFNTATGGRVIAQLVDLGAETGFAQLQFTAGRLDESFSIQQDSSGVINSIDLPITDPTVPVLGGTSTYEKASFEAGTDVIFGGGTPSFSPAFPGLGTSGNGPSVIGNGTFEVVSLDILGNIVETVTVTLDSTAGTTLTDVANAIDASAYLSASINVATGELVIDSDGAENFFFRNDETGLVSALGLEDVAGYGSYYGQDFNTGEFEVVVVNDEGRVTDIFQVDIAADANDPTDGVVSLSDIVDRFNDAAAVVGAPVSASIVEDPQDSTKNRIRFISTSDHEFTFRSDDSRLLAALGLHQGPALDEELNAPIEDAVNVARVGDLIGPTIKAEFDTDGQIKITTTPGNEITFTDDTSYFLAASQMNALFQGTDAGTMKVSATLLENHDLLAASKNGEAGNNEAALLIAELQFEDLLNGGSHDDFYRAIISELGIEGAQVAQFLSTNNTILTELETLQEQQAGVSLDEESINLIQYQQAFTAAARVISAVDEMLDIVVNVLGA